jgi:hypothetical protein
MKAQSKSCRHLLSRSHITNEIGGDALPTVIPNLPKCQLDEGVYAGWDKCVNTPYEGPCWQHPSMTLEEWNAWAKQRLRELQSG